MDGTARHGARPRRRAAATGVDALSAQAAPVARVRILCRDASGRVLLLRWRDPVDGHVFWEPPGGGIEPGESPLEAAERELFEETGYRARLPEDYLVVPRRYRFAGRDFRHDEAFYLAEVEGDPAPGAFTEEELETCLGWRFVAVSELGGLGDPLEPPELPEVCAEVFGPPAGHPS